MNACLFMSLSFLSCYAMDMTDKGSAIPAPFPKPFLVNPSTPMVPANMAKVIQQCHISSEIVKKRDKVFLRVKLYYRNLKVMQNEYELDLNKLAKM